MMSTNEAISMHPMYYYISTRASCDPCRMIYLCVPDTDASSEEKAKQFAECSGWREIAEQEAAILIVPIASRGWAMEPDTLLQDIFLETRNRFYSKNGEAIWGLAGHLMCWEPILYAVGYGSGAEFVGRSMVRCPNVLAAAALINGVPDDFTEGEKLSDHWLVPDVSRDYTVKNKEIPVKIWFYTEDENLVREAADYFIACDGAKGSGCERQIGTFTGKIWESPENQAEQVAVFPGHFQPEMKLSRHIMDECFAHVIRWKNGPDGTLAVMESRSEFYNNPGFLRRSVKIRGRSYGYSVYLPEGMTPEDVKGLALVFTVHGRGEPAWMFTTKNGWDKLADQKKEFILVSPDSPGNIWFLNRDGEAFVRMVAAIAEEFSIDQSRVYLTGFSNGGMISREVGIRYPGLFAAISPWNAPCGDTSTMMWKESSTMEKKFGKELEEVIRHFEKEGWELPCSFIYGDKDGKAFVKDNMMMSLFLKANGCRQEPDDNHPVKWVSDGQLTDENYYTRSRGYREGNRFSTWLYNNAEGKIRVMVTVMKNMPHGAIYEESLATWEFLKHYRRKQDSLTIEYIP